MDHRLSAVDRWVDRLWRDLDDHGEWSVLADWLVELRDPRSVLLRHALGGGALEEAGTHWERLRDVHVQRGFDAVGGLPWELSFLLAARELLRCPAVSNFRTLLQLVSGLTDAQWFAVSPRLDAALQRWPDELRAPDDLGFRERFRGVPPPWWGLVRSTDINFVHDQELPAPESAWFESLTQLAGGPEVEGDIEWLGQLPVSRLELWNLPEGPVGFATVRKLALYTCVHAPQWVERWAPSSPRLEEIALLCLPGVGQVLDLSMLGSSALARQLRSLRFVRYSIPDSSLPDWRALPALETLALPGCRLGGAASLLRALSDDALPALRYLDLRWARVEASLETLATWPGIDRLEGLGIPFGKTAEGFLRRGRPFESLRRLSLAGGAPIDVLQRWLRSPGTGAPQLERLDLFVDPTPRSTALWAGALDRWPRLKTLSLPMRMLTRPDDVSRWMASPVFRGLRQLTLHGNPAPIGPFARAMAEGGMSPRIVVAFPNFEEMKVVGLLRRHGFTVDDADDLDVTADERDWSPQP